MYSEIPIPRRAASRFAASHFAGLTLIAFWKIIFDRLEADLSRFAHSGNKIPIGAGKTRQTQSRGVQRTKKQPPVMAHGRADPLCGYC